MPLDAVSIRFATPDDAAAISRILFESFSTFREQYTPTAFDVVTPSADAIVARFREGPMWIAMANGKFVGTVSVLPQPEWLYIRSMAVTPEARGLGIANKLMAAIEEYAVAEGFDRLFLYTTYFSTGAIGLYEKHGFKRGRETTADEWYGTPGLAMDKWLTRGFEIREVRIEDVELLSEVATRAYLQHFQHLWEDAGTAYAERCFNVTEIGRQLSDESNRYYLAFIDSEAVGFLKVRPDHTLPIFDGEDAFEIERIYLVNEAKGKGIGKAMMQFATGMARETGKGTVWLKVMDSNMQTVGFYESCGFETVGKENLDLPQLKKELSGMFVMKNDLRDQQ